MSVVLFSSMVALNDCSGAVFCSGTMNECSGAVFCSDTMNECSVVLQFLQ